mgnify:CR=1 FL=1
MAKLTPEEYAAKHAQRLKGSTEDIRRGIERVTASPGAAAVKQQGKLVANFGEAVNSGRWARATGAVTTADWQSAAIGKGLGRIAAGIDAAQSKQVQMAGRLLAATDAAAAKVAGMPSTTLEDNIGRMTLYVREMAKSKGRIKAG